MKTFILIHGSWHSAWNWHKVLPILKEKGHRAIAIDLPGMGRNKTPVSMVKFSTTVNYICNIIDQQEGQVILVGHSKNGIMISQAAEQRPEKIEKLIYLAAYLVPDGKTQREYSMMDTAGVLKPFVVLDEHKQSSILRPEIYREGLYHDCDDNIVELAKLLLSAEPFESGITPLSLTEDKFGTVSRYYIECTEDRAVTPFIQRKMYTELTCNKVYSLPSSHSPFFSMPSALSDIFCEIAEIHENPVDKKIKENELV
jgi:predicted alpha/beta hydrolase family esterase